MSSLSDQVKELEIKAEVYESLLSILKEKIEQRLASEIKGWNEDILVHIGLDWSWIHGHHRNALCVSLNLPPPPDRRSITIMILDLGIKNAFFFHEKEIKKPETSGLFKDRSKEDLEIIKKAVSILREKVREWGFKVTSRPPSDFE